MNNWLDKTIKKGMVDDITIKRLILMNVEAIIGVIRVLRDKCCGKYYSWTSCRCPYLFDCRVPCSFFFCRFLRCRTFSTPRCSCFSTGRFRRCLSLLGSINRCVLWWFRMLRLFDRTQFVRLSPYYWHFYVLRERG